MGLIYLVTNRVNGKEYVGQTRRPLRVRKSNHLRDARNGFKGVFNDAIRKYSPSSFEIFAEVPDDELDYWEEETRKRLIESHTGKKASEETRAKMRLAQQRRRAKERGLNTA